MGPRCIAAAVLLCHACGRLGFDREDTAPPAADAPTDVGPALDAPPDVSDSAPIDSAPDSPPASCAANPTYTSIGPFPSRYRAVPTSLSWTDATQACAADGAHLAVPDSMGEALAIGERGDWIGITDELTEGTWLTVFSTAPAYLVFQAGQPNGGDTENCLRVDGSGAFEDRECSDTRDFVCECPP